MEIKEAKEVEETKGEVLNLNGGTPIEVKGEEYTLFLNRKGIVAYENYTSRLAQSTKKEILGKASEIDKEQDEMEKNIYDERDPISVSEELNKKYPVVDGHTLECMRRLYWIMLSTYHHMSYNEAKEWLDEAINEYGSTQMIYLANQIISDTNKEPDDLKKLKALRPIQADNSETINKK